MTEKLEIPEDLRDDYEYAKRCGNGRLIPGHSAVRLIERIARLTAQVDALKAPVTDEEMVTHALHYIDLIQPIRSVPVLTRTQADQFLAARLAAAQGAKEESREHHI